MTPRAVAVVYIGLTAVLLGLEFSPTLWVALGVGVLAWVHSAR